MCEVATHYFTMNWNACYDTAVTDMKLYFYFLTSITFSGVTIALRKVNVPICRIPKGFWDIASFVMDWFLIIGSVGLPVVWHLFGKKTTLKVFTFVQIISACAQVPRIGINLGPSRKLWILGVLVTAPSAIGPIFVNPRMQDSGNQLMHGLLGTTFLITEVGLGYVLLFVKEEQSSALPGEETPLVV